MRGGREWGRRESIELPQRLRVEAKPSSEIYASPVMHRCPNGTAQGSVPLPRYDRLTPAELEAIRRFIEEAEKVDLVNPSELESLRALVELHWPHLLHKLPQHTRH